MPLVLRENFLKGEAVKIKKVLGEWVIEKPEHLLDKKKVHVFFFFFGGGAGGMLLEGETLSNM